ncbi:STAS domain-containing protein [Streptomyces sp. NPDC058700]|uniref:STAS domain-containing protein n=1 Tax=unclassified Streptomyces TaxID=2593676 RepID=UPI003646479E
MEQQVKVLQDEDGVRVIVCKGEFDQSTLPPLKAATTEAAADPALRQIVLDVSQVTFADSAMLNTLLLLLRSGRLVLAGPIPVQLDRLMQITQSRNLFTTADSAEAARATNGLGPLPGRPTVSLGVGHAAICAAGAGGCREAG